MTDKKCNCDGYLFDIANNAEPVLISACLLGIPCRWHGRRPKKREKLIERLKKKYVLIPVCPEQLGGMPTPRTSEKLIGNGADVLDGRLRIIAPETGQDVTRFHVNGAKYTFEIAKIVGANRAYLKGGSPSLYITGDKLKYVSVVVAGDVRADRLAEAVGRGQPISKRRRDRPILGLIKPDCSVIRRRIIHFSPNSRLGHCIK